MVFETDVRIEETVMLEALLGVVRGDISTAVIRIERD
jgi:hypothetical protein